MKYIFILLQFVLVQKAFSETLYCSGTAFVPSSQVLMRCHSGQCIGNVSSEFISTSGSCDNGASFSARGYLRRSDIYGSCVNNRFSETVSGGTVEWTGTCSGGGVFIANSEFIPSNTVFGTCTRDGSFTLQLGSESVRVTATCYQSN